ncbi:hypothetical protein GCM10009093_14820 [Brevundimonas terrae]|uniref:Uncharacterized protein n=1 Tax=Brevundimonas terrae TaxID=363631 RepID=A0ABN0YAP6_9CAUL
MEPQAPRLSIAAVATDRVRTVRMRIFRLGSGRLPRLGQLGSNKEEMRLRLFNGDANLGTTFREEGIEDQ